MFWYILGVISFVALIVGIILNKRYEYDSMGIIISTIGGITLVLLLIIIPMFAINNKQNINTFRKQKEYIECNIVNDPIENAALTNKKIELNTWLVNAQYEKENYSFFTLLPDEVMELTIIE